jgi:hypothetical protein
VHRQQEHRRDRRLRLDLARGLDAGHARHRDVEDGDVGLRGDRLGDGVDAVLGLGDDLHVVLAVDQHADAGAHDAMVVGDQDSQHV